MIQDRLGTSKYGRAVPHAPFLAPNKVLGMDKETPLSMLEFPQYVSTKYNGVRGLTLGGTFMSRSMKPTNMCATVKDEFLEIADWAHKNKVVLDGEFHAYSHNTVGKTLSILAGTKPLPSDFYFKCFYCLPYDTWNQITQESANLWAFHDNNIIECRFPRLQLIKQKILNSLDEVNEEIDSIRFSNKEGLMFLDPRSYYKSHARATVAEATLLKFKFYSEPVDAKIISLTKRKERLEDVETKYNTGTGKAEQVHTQDSFRETDVGGCMVCQQENKEFINVPFPVGTPIPLRGVYYDSFGDGSDMDLKGKWLSFRRLSVEDKDKPVAIKDVQFRDAKD